MKLLIKLSAVLLLLSLISCSSITINSDYDPAIDFDSYKTYKWYEGKDVEGDELVKFPLIKKRVVISVDKALSAKGYQLSTSDDVDFVVIVHAGLKEKTQLNTYNYGGYGYGRYGSGWGGGGMSTTDVRTYDEATLVVDVADLEKKELVWRGSATGVVGSPPQDQAEAQANMDDIINKILNKFPPEKK